MLSAGCSIAPPLGQHDLVLGGVVRDELRRIERRMIPGFDLRFRGGQEGVGVGWTDLTVAVPYLARDGRGSDAFSSLDLTSLDTVRYAPPLGVSWSNDRGEELWFGWVAVKKRRGPSRVRLVRTTEVGVALGWARSAKGLMLGFRSGVGVVVHPDVNGTFLLHCGVRAG